MTTDEYNSYIKNYLENDKTQSAIMLTAPWGTGKSYYIRNDLSRFLEENKLSYAVVSAYGLSSIADINKELFLEIKFQKTKKAMQMACYVWENDSHRCRGDWKDFVKKYRSHRYRF